MIRLSLLIQTSRFFSTSTACRTQSSTPIPGLFLFQNILQCGQQRRLQDSAIDLHKKILTNLTNDSSQSCKTFLSEEHNLDSDEYYRPIEVNDLPERKIRGQHFEKYGEDGHKLTYFIGNNNLPKFIKNGLLARVLQLPEIIELKKSNALNWNFTFNTYATAKKRAAKLAGFDFHKDIKSNGEVTMIYSIGARSEFQIRHPNCITDTLTLPLLSNSLLVLSNEARWDYEHRVIPVTVKDDSSLVQSEVQTIRRMSLVLGFAT